MLEEQSAAAEGVKPSYREQKLFTSRQIFIYFFLLLKLEGLLSVHGAHQREPLQERRGDSAPFFLNYFNLSTSLFVLFVVAVSGELQYPAAARVE